MKVQAEKEPNEKIVLQRLAVFTDEHILTN
jgi:hypothetical protein